MHASDYENSNSKMVLTTQGRLVGEDQRRSIRITVTESSRTVEQLNGYENTVANSESFTNTPDAYRYFLAALDKAEFTKARRTNTPDPVGTCALGNVYIYEIQDGSSEVMNHWSSTCGPGSFGGNGSLTRTLFQNQITGYTTFASKITL